ncbi:hypothetical protein [Arcanobacterium bovis]|uniref:hypothetical protein n=1 Tax=Arcanobacterium bovis TaxID=2529275 RepID=UPI0013F16106|nr:hypothetical protein [Arcanobacterium bovis]
MMRPVNTQDDDGGTLVGHAPFYTNEERQRYKVGYERKHPSTTPDASAAGEHEV